MDNDENPPQGIHAQRDKALLALRVRVFDGDGKNVTQRLLGMGKADTVLVQIGFCLGWIKFDAHDQLYIYYAYKKLALSVS